MEEKDSHPLLVSMQIGSAFVRAIWHILLSQISVASVVYNLGQTASAPDFISYFCVCFLLDGDIWAPTSAWWPDLDSWVSWFLHNCKSFSCKIGVDLVCTFESFGTIRKFKSPLCCLVMRPTFESLASTLVLLSVASFAATCHTCVVVQKLFCPFYLSRECCHFLLLNYKLVLCTSEWCKMFNKRKFADVWVRIASNQKSKK